MKKSKLLVSLLTSIIAVNSLTACNSGVRQPTSSTLSYAIKSLTQEKLVTLYDKISDINKKTTTEEMLDIIQEISEINDGDDDQMVNFINLNFFIAFLDNKFGTNPEVLQAFATSLGKMNFLSEEAQYQLSLCILLGKFGDNPVVLKPLAISLGNMKITSKNAKYYIVRSIVFGEFSNNSEVLKALATSLGQMNITSDEAHKELAEAIDSNRFGDDLEVLKALATSLGKMNITDKNSIQMIGVKYFKLNPNLAKYILSRWIISDDLIANSSEDFKQYIESYHLFGQLKNDLTASADQEESSAGNMIEGISNTFPSIDIALKRLNIPVQDNVGSYGFIYNEDGKPEALIIFASADSLDEQALGFLRMTIDTQPLYGFLSDNVKIYKISTVAEYTYVDNRYDVADNDSPNWLKNARAYNKFDVDNYNDKALIKFALSFTDKLEEDEIKRLTIGAIQRLIINEGNGARIGSDIAADKKLKDDINIAFIGIYTDDELDDKINQTWSDLHDQESKAKLIFLIGQIAKSGALGYEHGGANQANTLYYTLAQKLTNKFLQEFPEDENSQLRESLIKLKNKLDSGTCIEVASNEFMLENPILHINTVWKRSTS